MPLLRYHMETGGGFGVYAALEAARDGVPLPFPLQEIKIPWEMALERPGFYQLTQEQLDSLTR